MKIIIAGAYSIGTHLARLLSRTDNDITLIDDDGERLSKIAADCDLLTLQASPTSVRSLNEVEAGEADLVIAVTPNEHANLSICTMAKTLGAKKTVARVDTDEYSAPELRDFFEKIGIDSIIYPEELAATDIINGLKMSWVRQRWDVHGGALVMLGIKLRESCTILNKPLRELCGPDDPYIVVAVKRGDDTIIPRGDDVLRLGDLAYLMTTRPFIPHIRQIVGKEGYADVKNVMVMGGGKTAVKAISEMPEYMKVKVIEQDEDRCEELNDLIGSRSALIIHGDGRDMPLLEDEGIRSTQAFVALTGNAETNILACLTAKRLGVRKTVAMVENVDYVVMAENLDIGTIINRKAIAASHIYQMLLDPNVSNVRFLMTANADVAEFVPKKGSRITLRPVKDLGLPKGMTIGGMVRDGEGLLVSGNTQFREGDSVMVFCHGIDMKKVEKLFI